MKKKTLLGRAVPLNDVDFLGEPTTLEGQKKHVEHLMKYRSLELICKNFINWQRTLKEKELILPTNSVCYGTEYSGNESYWRVDKEHPLHPISIRPDNKPFYPIRQFDMMNILDKDNVWLAGGAIRSCLDGEVPNDLDVFCRTQKSFFNVINKFCSPLMSKNFRLTFMCLEEDYYTMFTGEKTAKYNQVESVYDILIPPDNINIVDILDTQVHIKCKIKNKFNLATFIGTSPLYKNLKIQVIYEPDNNHKSTIDLMEGFDFYIGQFGFDGEYFYFSKRAAADYQARRLTVNDLRYPVSVLRRISKYGSYGYTMTSDEARKVFDKLTSTDYNKEDLIGYID